MILYCQFHTVLMNGNISKLALQAPKGVGWGSRANLSI